MASTTTLDGLHTTFSFDDALVGLYGTPSVSGDTIFFTPTNFVASSTNGTSGLNFTSSTFNVKVSAKAGYAVNGIDLIESGDYLLYQPTGSGALGVDLTGQIRVRDLATLAETTDSIQATAPMTALGMPSHNWTANAGTSFANSSAVNLTIENILLAYTTSAPSLAFIEKKYVGAGALVSAVPEPETYAMFLAGLGLLGMAARRRS